MKNPEDIVTGLSTKSSKIRALAQEGYSRSEIAIFLNIRYQHVRNVLLVEEEKRAGEKSVTYTNLREGVERRASVSLFQDPQKEWFWEGNVQSVLARHLERSDWRLVNVSNTESKERGVDIRAEKAEHVLLFEVKGYPSATYSDPKRAHEKKKTSPTLQAGHWYAQAVLKAMRLKSSSPDAQIVIGLPDFKRYKDIFEETKGSLKTLGFQVWGVDQNGVVSIW